ncbi:hypothetical protein GCM10023220_11360 [Streptomyces ziwulingensis]|uniref:Uncharacterized protein n=1 Tax=Streptomyces ziwulingensis TaxID=1045501 RepID=A0ABP9B2Y9_9ACTN
MPPTDPPAGNSVMADLLKDQQAVLSKKTWQTAWAARQEQAHKTQQEYNNAPHEDHRAQGSPMTKHVSAGAFPKKPSSRR